LEAVDILQLLNVQYPHAKRLRRSFGALAKAEVSYGGQVDHGMSNDEVFSSMSLGAIWQFPISWRIQPNMQPFSFSFYIRQSIFNIEY
jgi:hypothetical protein